MTMQLAIQDLIPPVNRRSPLIQDFCGAFQEIAEEWIASIGTLEELVNPETVPAAYIDFLAYLVGGNILNTDVVTDELRRKQLSWLVDWLKQKGTYKAVDIISIMVSLNLYIYDLYTNDYSNFITEKWFTGDEGENPEGLTSDYYKSPHFGMTAIMDKYYDAGTYDGIAYPQHLWRPGLFVNVPALIEMIRPVNTVPSYYAEVIASCNESGDTTTNTANNVSCKAFGDWDYTGIFFDGTKA